MLIAKSHSHKDLSICYHKLKKSLQSRFLHFCKVLFESQISHSVTSLSFESNLIYCYINSWDVELTVSKSKIIITIEVFLCRIAIKLLVPYIKAVGPGDIIDLSQGNRLYNLLHSRSKFQDKAVFSGSVIQVWTLLAPRTYLCVITEYYYCDSEQNH